MPGHVDDIDIDISTGAHHEGWQIPGELREFLFGNLSDEEVAAKVRDALRDLVVAALIRQKVHAEVAGQVNAYLDKLVLKQ